MRFDDAAANAIRIADQYASAHNVDVIVVRDLLGRNALVLSGDDVGPTETLRQELIEQCQPFIGTQPVFMLRDMLAPELILQSPDRHPAPFTLTSSNRVTILERAAVGADWLTPTRRPTSRRVTLYGFKGGVGRSTATFALAQHLANMGQVVLVVDLDLESPGVSTMLAPSPDDLPEHGILDHLVEYAVGNESGLDLVAQSRAVATPASNGEVWFAAVAGRSSASGGYLDKLNRVYVDLPPDPSSGRRALPFGGRLEAAVAFCEAQVTSASRRPDVVLLDSRSGIHDIAAVAITQLSSLSLLFATDNPQTWQGYGQLFAKWQTRLDADLRSDLRQRIQMVGALVPPHDEEAYIRAFADHAQDCFAQTLYDDETDIQDDDYAFNFSPQDTTAPHFPIPIRHSDDLIGVLPGLDSRWSSGGAVNYAYADFLDGATRLIMEQANAES